MFSLPASDDCSFQSPATRDHAARIIHYTVYTYGLHMFSPSLTKSSSCGRESLGMGLIQASTNRWACQRKHVLTNYFRTKSRDYCKLIRQLVLFESQMCTGWLQWHLCQVRSFKTHLKWKDGTFRGSIGLK